MLLNKSKLKRQSIVNKNKPNLIPLRGLYCYKWQAKTSGLTWKNLFSVQSKFLHFYCMCSTLFRAGTYWRGHDGYKPRRDSRWRWGCRSRKFKWRSIGTQGREWARGGARFPESRSSGFILHEQGRRARTVLHGHVTQTQPADWVQFSCLFANRVRRRKRVIGLS